MIDLRSDTVTQTNLIGLLSHCQRGYEYIVGHGAHTYMYEGGGAAVLGGMRQAGILAAAGLYALENNVQRLQEDHDNARRVASVLAELSPFSLQEFPQTNMVMLSSDMDLAWAIRLSRSASASPLLATASNVTAPSTF